MGIVVFFVIWLACAFIAGVIGEVRGRWGLGVILGVLLGVIGIIVISVIPRDYDALARREAKERKRIDRERQLREAARERYRV